MERPIWLAVHALFADASYDEPAALSERVLSTDTVPHPSNAVGVAELLA